MHMTSFKDIDEYIAKAPTEAQEGLQAMRKIAQEEAPEVVEAIKYGMPTFVLNGNMICIGAFKKHLSLFPFTEAMEKQIKGATAYRAGKGTAQFPIGEPLPLDIIRQMVKMRVAEHRAKTKPGS